jgi:hypothetical protein
MGPSRLEASGAGGLRRGLTRAEPAGTVEAVLVVQVVGVEILFGSMDIGPVELPPQARLVVAIKGLAGVIRQAGDVR